MRLAQEPIVNGFVEILAEIIDANSRMMTSLWFSESRFFHAIARLASAVMPH